MKIYITIAFLFFGFAAMAQNTGIIEGKVLDKEINNEPLAFASITIKEANQNTTTNIDGDYFLELNPGNYTLTINFPGYKKLKISNVQVIAGEITSIKKVAIGALQIPSLGNAISSKEK